jgi:integrase
MVARTGSGPKIARSVTNCADCLAWGETYAQGVCLACYNFAAARFRQHVGICAACRREVRLKQGYCRLCWCQARRDRAASATDARSAVVLAPYLAQVRGQQLFLADLYRPHAQPRTVARRTGTKGRPFKPPPRIAVRPGVAGVQLLLLTDLPRSYRPGSIDLRSEATPDNPWLHWALHLAHTAAETRGFNPTVRRALNRNLVMLLASHHEGDLVRVSDFHYLIRQRGNGALIHVIDVLSTMDVLLDDRPAVFDTWLESKTHALPRPIADQIRRWSFVLRHGGPRRRPRHANTAMTYVRVTMPALTVWSREHEHLREITRDDILTYLDTLHGESRNSALTALRSLFSWAKRDGVIFRNPAAGIHMSARAPAIWQPLTDDEIAQAIRAATTPQAKVCVVLAAVHAARPGHIRALQLEDIDLGNRQIVIAGHRRPLDELTHRILLDWLDHRRRQWPHTANRHLLISKESALHHGPVSAPWILNLRGQPATLERLRIDRQLEEALASGGDPLHVASVFGVSQTTAIRYALNALKLIGDDHADTPSEFLRTQVSIPDNDDDARLGFA